MQTFIIIAFALVCIIGFYNWNIYRKLKRLRVLTIAEPDPSYFYVPDVYHDGMLYSRHIDETPDSHGKIHRTHYVQAFDVESNCILWKKTAYFPYQAEDGTTHITGSVLSPVEHVFFDEDDKLLVVGSGRVFEFEKHTGEILHVHLIQNQEQKRYLDDRYSAIILARDCYKEKVDDKFSGVHILKSEIAFYSIHRKESQSEIFEQHNIDNNQEGNPEGGLPDFYYEWQVTFGPVSETVLDGEVTILLNVRENRVVDFSFK